MKAAVSIFVFLIAAGISILYLVQVEKSKNTQVSEYSYGVCGGVVYPDDYPHEIPVSEEIKKGDQLFKAYCAACHKIDKHSTGPALRNVHQRYTTVDIIKFIRNDFSGVLKYNGEQKCTLFPNLSDEDIQSILAYTN